MRAELRLIAQNRPMTHARKHAECSVLISVGFDSCWEQHGGERASHTVACSLAPEPHAVVVNVRRESRPVPC